MINCRIKDETGYTFDVDIPDYIMTGNGSEIKLADLDRSTVEEIIEDFSATIYRMSGMKRGGGVSVTPEEYEQSEGAKPEVVQADGLPVSPASIHQYLDKLKPNPVPAAMPAVPILAPAMPMVSLSEPMDFKPKAQVIDTSLTWIGDDHSFAVYKYDGVWYLETNASETINPDDCFLECGLTAHVEKSMGNCLSSVLTGSPDMFLYQVYVAEYEESACTVWYGSVDDSILAEPIEKEVDEETAEQFVADSSVASIPKSFVGQDWYISSEGSIHLLFISLESDKSVLDVLAEAGLVGQSLCSKKVGGHIFRSGVCNARRHDLVLDNFDPDAVDDGIVFDYSLTKIIESGIPPEPIAIPENIRGDDWFIQLVGGKYRLHIHVSCMLTVEQVLERAGIIGRADGYRETAGWIFRNADHGRADSYDLKIDSYNGIVAEGVEVTYD